MPPDRTVVLAELLSHIPVGSRIGKLDDKVLEVIKKEPEGSLLKQCFPVHPIYGDSPRFQDAFDLLRMGGSLALWSSSWYETDEITGILHAFARKHRDELSQKTKTYLARKAEEVKAYQEDRVVAAHVR